MTAFLHLVQLLAIIGGCYVVGYWIIRYMLDR